jgi:hypothetical protein
MKEYEYTEVFEVKVEYGGIMVQGMLRRQFTAPKWLKKKTWPSFCFICN